MTCIGFPMHVVWRQVKDANAARGAWPDESWALSDHRTMAKVIAAEPPAA